ncbi:cytochrome d ubiquinol oxidase subunit II [Planotetraspora kaengkrachanensis]|uniref:Cytochrome D ubiquinol oxidase subunit II n=1 Tax=Planotetraspora kaengkrachanensis TaxID=575193 RepID=A0A8J3PPU0_9ACTN|nr:cytochrome d ubiquinol oxidase subunit II [Planotetraspora kaengkrachanensis]GIG78031.1 cytochrome D ubiquinol oxidase subunit II [Planotetraspora kaengkrachanensis]
MDSAQILLAVMWAGLTVYALLGGADFGGGVWDLLAGRSRAGMPQRRLIEHSIGPVWEANHVWLIFVLVVLWTGFPLAFASVMSTLYIPLTLAALGIIARGAAFAFRKASTELWQQRLFGGAFALSSVLTPFFLGTVAGGIASARVPPGLAAGDVVGSWLNPTSLLGGVLAVLVCAYLAAVYLCDDAARSGTPQLAEGFRRRALLAAVVTGAGALAGIAVLHWDAPRLFSGLIHRALPLVVLSAVLGIASIVLLALRRHLLVRVAAVLAVAAVMWGWPVAQYPAMLPPGLTYQEAAAAPVVTTTVLVVAGVGALLVVPSLVWLFVLQRRMPYDADTSG